MISAEEFGGSNDCPQRLANRPISLEEDCRGSIDNGLRRIVADETARQFRRDKPSGSRMCRQNVEHTFAIPNASARKKLVAEHSLLAVIVQTGTVQEQSFLVWFLNGPAGETARNFLHVLLRVSAIHAHRVQLHQFARVIFVEAAVDSGGLVSFGGIRTGNARTPIIKIVKHRRRMCGRAEQIAEPPQRKGTNRLAIETGEQVTIV